MRTSYRGIAEGVSGALTRTNVLEAVIQTLPDAGSYLASELAHRLYVSAILYPAAVEIASGFPIEVCVEKNDNQVAWRVQTTFWRDGEMISDITSGSLGT